MASFFHTALGDRFLSKFYFKKSSVPFPFSDLQILGKAEFLNPGGSVKDRVAVKIIEEVIERAFP